jgi:hypothetical protein
MQYDRRPLAEPTVRDKQPDQENRNAAVPNVMMLLPLR